MSAGPYEAQSHLTALSGVETELTTWKVKVLLAVSTSTSSKQT